MSSPAYTPLSAGPNPPALLPNPSYDPTPTPPKLPTLRRLAFYSSIPLLYILILLILPNPPPLPDSSSDDAALPNYFPSFTSIAFIHLLLLGLLGSLPWTSLFLLSPETKLDHFGIQWLEGNLIVITNFIGWTVYLVWGGRSPDLDSQAFLCFCMVMIHIFGLMGYNICQLLVPFASSRPNPPIYSIKREREAEPLQLPSIHFPLSTTTPDWSSQCYKERVSAGLEVPRMPPVEGIQMQTVRPTTDVEAARPDPPQRDLLVRFLPRFDTYASISCHSFD
jgi:hypothetical protein